MTNKRKEAWIRGTLVLLVVLTGWIIGFLLRDGQDDTPVATVRQTMRRIAQGTCGLEGLAALRAFCNEIIGSARKANQIPQSCLF